MEFGAQLCDLLSTRAVTDDVIVTRCELTFAEADVIVVMELRLFTLNFILQSKQ